MKNQQVQQRLSFAKDLRRRQTDAERKIWALLRSRQLAGFKFRRQEVIGFFIVDFCCFEQRLVVELDGGQHAEREASDRQRTLDLNQRGFRVLRFWDHQVLLEPEAVVIKILAETNQIYE
ncbi:MAG: endonuclease domain-containing protein [Elusimicrobia bacterium]|nr:endonuclease domain-containing protein [Elusimicrobiota bacterium]